MDLQTEGESKTCTPVPLPLKVPDRRRTGPPLGRNGRGGQEGPVETRLSRGWVVDTPLRKGW